MKAFETGRLTENGKPEYIICSKNVHHIEIHGSHIVKTEREFVSPYADRVLRKSIDIKCRKCIGCRLDYSREWADRCVLEAQYHESNYFVTLTYDPISIPYNPIEVDFDTGEVLRENATLRFEDLQKFFKKLRRYYKHDNILRYYACGEYGELHGRPHYHCLIFGLKLDDLKEVPYARNGYKLYESEFLNKTWNKGIVRVGELTWETCAYTARYIMKKQKGAGAKIYSDNNILPEFVTMSTKKGIGYQYFEEHGNYIYQTDEINISLPKGGKKIRPPRYYDNLFDVDHHEELEAIKLNRQAKAQAYHDSITLQTDLPYYKVLEAQGRIAAKKALALKRGYEGGLI